MARTQFPRLQGVVHNGRLVAVHSAEDLSAGLSGVSAENIYGYTADSALKLMRGVLLWQNEQPRGR